MKKIAVVGLYSIRNVGDHIICETTKYLIDNAGLDTEIVEVDALPRQKSSYKGFNFFTFAVSVLLRRLGQIFLNQKKCSWFRYKFEYFSWWLRLHNYYKDALCDVDAIVFSGGGFLKFRTQGLNYYVEQIVRVAFKRKIPVMMNAVGVEGYSKDDIRCQRLKAAINLECVKIITTRDDIILLENKYVINPKIYTAHVGDPAFWIPETYDIIKNEKTDIIGINVIRGNVYRDYGNKLSYQELKEFYKGLLFECDKRNLKWMLFSNGMKGDQQFGREILQEMNLPLKNNLLPAPKNSIELIGMISNFQCILGARLHACISAYAIDIPAVGLIWNPKTELFAGMVGKQSNYFSEDKLDVPKIVDALERSITSVYDEGLRNEWKRLTQLNIIKFLSGLDYS